MSYISTIKTAIASGSTSLDLKYTKFGVEGAKYLADALAKNPSITSLDLSFSNIGDRGVEYLADMLAKNHSITSLDLMYTKFGVEGAKYLADALAKNHSITMINLQWNNIGDEGAKYLADALSKNSSITTIMVNSHYYHIKPFLIRNENYKRSKPSHAMFTNTCALPTELYNIIGQMLLLQC